MNRKLNENDRYSDVAFYNYFLRPAYDDEQSNGFGKKGYYQEIDGKVAFSAFCGILKELRPNLVIFATKVGYDKMDYFRKKTKTDFGNIVIERVAHPSCKWWTVYGKQDFENYLCEYWLKEKPKYYLNFEKLQSIHKELKLMFTDKYVKESCYKEGNLSYSQLHFKIRDYTFCFQIEIKKEEAHYWSYFYHTNECKILQVNFKEEKYKYDFLSTDNNETIIAETKKRIQQIINELSR